MLPLSAAHPTCPASLAGESLYGYRYVILRTIERLPTSAMRGPCRQETTHRNSPLRGGSFRPAPRCLTCSTRLSTSSPRVTSQ